MMVYSVVFLNENRPTDITSTGLSKRILCQIQKKYFIMQNLFLVRSARY